MIALCEGLENLSQGQRMRTQGAEEYECTGLKGQEGVKRGAGGSCERNRSRTRRATCKSGRETVGRELDTHVDRLGWTYVLPI